MSHPILVTGAAGGAQGSTGRRVASLLLDQCIPVRALVHKIDSRCDELRKQGAEVVEGDLNIPHYGLNRGCVQSRNDVESNEAQEHANSGLAL